MAKRKSKDKEKSTKRLKSEADLTDSEDTKADETKPSDRSTTESKDETTEKHYWLFKGEPETRIVRGQDVKFSYFDLEREQKPVCWEGVRNYEARNSMKQMKVGDYGFFYHSNCKQPGIVGIVRVVKQAYPDYSAWDDKHPYFDEKTDKDNPRWFMVDVESVRALPRLVGLHELRTEMAAGGEGSPLWAMKLLRRGRLSVCPVTEGEWNHVISMADRVVD
ncbi:thymocyte nuclear protein 1 isoform 1 [Lipomyces oligophaga]|uniref:thymocyte nuclear protein 1 isoform 1 n=1 Tax=Lipomyces oligophaga TaxID=45792 RepID=UPI0034CFCD21